MADNSETEYGKKNCSCHRHHVTLAVAVLLLGVSILTLLVVLVEVRVITPRSTGSPPVVSNNTGLDKLRKLIGDRPIVTLKNFTNWGMTEFTSDVYVTEPSTLGEIQSVVRAAKTLRLSVRCVGTAHSWAPLFADSGQILLRTTSLRTSHDRPNMMVNEPASFGGDYTVTVMSGLKLGEINQFLIANKLQLPVAPGSISLSIGGIIGTASHGSYVQRGTLSDYIVAIRVVDGGGDLREFNVFQHGDALRALQCCLGMCGVIYDITFKVEPLTLARVMELWPTTGSVMTKESLQNYTDKYQGLAMYWAPLSSVTEQQLAYYDRTGKLPSYNATDDLIWIHSIETPVFGEKPEKPSYLYENEITSSAPTSVTTLPPAMVTVSRTLAPTTAPMTTQLPNINVTRPPTWGPGLRYFKMVADYSKSILPENEPHYFHYPHAASNVDAKMLHKTFSFLVMIADDANFTNTLKIIAAFSRRIELWIRNGKVPINTVEMRFVSGSGSGCYLCPSNFGKPGGRAFSFEIIGSHSVPGFSEFAQELYEDVLKEFASHQVRLWWTKLYPYLSGYSARIRSSFGQQWQDFLSAREKYKLDKEDIFMNNQMKKLFRPIQ